MLSNMRDGLSPGPWGDKMSLCAQRQADRLQNNSVRGKGFGSDTDHKFCRISEEREIEAFETRLASRRSVRKQEHKKNWTSSDG